MANGEFVDAFSAASACFAAGLLSGSYSRRSISPLFSLSPSLYLHLSWICTLIIVIGVSTQETPGDLEALFAVSSITDNGEAQFSFTTGPATGVDSASVKVEVYHNQGEFDSNTPVSRR